EPHLDVRCCGLLLGNLVQLESKIPAENVDAVSLGCILAGADGALELGRDMRHVAAADGSVDGTDVDHAPALDAMQPSVAVDRRRVVELEDEIDIGTLTFGGSAVRLTEFGSCPHLSFVFSEILHNKWMYGSIRKHPLASRVNRKTA